MCGGGSRVGVMEKKGVRVKDKVKMQQSSPSEVEAFTDFNP